MTIGLGLRAQKGGAVAVAVALREGEPHMVLSTLIATHEPGDRLSLEPYGVAYGMVHDERHPLPDAEAAVRQGRDRQDRIAEDALRGVVQMLAPAVAGRITVALLTNRAGWITDLLGHSLAWAEHVPVVEGLAVRDALRAGLVACAIETVELDEKSLSTLAAEALGLSVADIEARLTALGAIAGKPWRKEQKAACLAAWIAAAKR